MTISFVTATDSVITILIAAIVCVCACWDVLGSVPIVMLVMMMMMMVLLMMLMLLLMMMMATTTTTMMMMAMMMLLLLVLMTIFAAMRLMPLQDAVVVRKPVHVEAYAS